MSWSDYPILGAAIDRVRGNVLASYIYIILMYIYIYIILIMYIYIYIYIILYI